MKPKRPSKIPSVAELQTLLRGTGLRSTTPRITVLQHFYEHGTSVTHAGLCEALDGRGLDRATLYRVLIDLAEKGILSRSDMGDHVWRFELKRSADAPDHTEEHPHFLCTDCGEVSCLPGLALKLDAKAKAPRAVTQQHVAVQLRGRCDNCA